MNKTLILLTLVVNTGLYGCSSIREDAGYKGVEKLVSNRTNFHMEKYEESTSTVEDGILSMPQKPLTIDEITQIAIINNRSLQAKLEDIGIAHADFVQAGLLQNPVFAGHARFPNTAGGTNTEFSVAENFLDILLLPLRKKLSAQQFKQAQLRIGSEVLQFISEVKSTYYALQGAQQILTLRQTVVQTSEAAKELSQRQRDAGNINELSLTNELAAYYEATLELAKSETEVHMNIEELNQLMGFGGKNVSWKIEEKLPDLPDTELTLEQLQALALSQRLDLAATCQETQLLLRALSVTRRSVITGVNIGISTERDSDRTRVTGPTWDLELPLFDRRQAALARLKAQLRQNKHRIAAMENEIKSEIVIILDKMTIARRTAQYYREFLIPLRIRTVDLTLQHYNYMLMGVYQLLQAKRDEINARKNYIEAKKDYWVIRADLERVVGGSLSIGISTAKDIEPTKPVYESHHHHHTGGQS